MTDVEPDRQVVPALDTLVKDQRELFDELERGFGRRVDVVEWCHKASVRTLGQLPDEWAAEILSDRYRLAAMLDDQRVRDRTTKHAPDDERARRERRMLADDELLRASRSAMQLLGQQAEEYIETDEQGSGIEGDQRWLAMRPGLHDLAARQRGSIRRVLGLDDAYPGGLTGYEDVSEWVRGVIRATKGVDGGISTSAVWDLYWRNALTGPVDSASMHALIAEDVLSVMNRSIRETATAAREAVEEEKVRHGTLET